MNSGFCRCTATLLTLIGALTPAATAFAQQPPPRYASALLGTSSVNENIGFGFAFGLEGGAFFLNSLGLGGYLRSSNHSDDISSFFFGFGILYRDNNFFENLTLGAYLGSGKFTSQGQSGNSATALSLKIAYDYPFLNHSLSLGGDLSFTWCEPGDTLLTAVSPMLNVKWWF